MAGKKKNKEIKTETKPLTEKEKEKIALETKARVKEEAQIKAKAEAEAQREVREEAAQKAQEQAEQEKKEYAELLEQAQVLGITPSKVSVAGSRVKDKGVEAAKHYKISMNRLKNRIKKKMAESKLTPRMVRKKLLLARLGPGGRLTPEQIKQCNAELHAINSKRSEEDGGWFPAYRDSEGVLHCWKLPKELTAYEKFMAI